MPRMVIALNAAHERLEVRINTQHSYADRFSRRESRRALALGVYVNRNMIGALGGVQPFGGCGLSSTGAKTGSHTIYIDLP